MSTDTKKPIRSHAPARVWVKRGLGTLAVLGGLLWGVYEYQPIRYDFLPRTPPASNPWTDPDSTHLFAPGTRVTVVTAHPDDAEFYIGGLLTRLAKSGAQITLIVCTDGDKGYYPFSDVDNLRRIRQPEQREAARLWNAQEVVFLSQPDGRLFATPEVVTRIADALKRTRPEYVLAFDYHYPPRMSHRDHRNAGDAAEQAVHQAGVGQWLCRFSTMAPNFAVDITEQWQAKRELLSVHKSQFYGDRLVRVEGIVQHAAQADGKLLQVLYAEGLRCTLLK